MTSKRGSISKSPKLDCHKNTNGNDCTRAGERDPLDFCKAKNTMDSDNICKRNKKFVTNSQHI